MKELLKRIWNGIITGIKKVPAKVYVFIFLTLILVGLQIALFKPYGEIFIAHKDLYIEQSNIFAHKSADKDLMDELFLKEQSIRDSYINKDLNNVSNPLELFSSYVLMLFCKVDIIGQSFVILGFVLADWKLLRISLKYITKKFFSNREKRKSEKVSEKKLNSKHA